MTTLDFSPLFRSVIGFDRLASTLESAARSEPAGYPPYDLAVADENRYRLTLAVAGWTAADLEIETADNVLRIAGRHASAQQAPAGKLLHRGIARRGFERTFQLADHVRVIEARLEHGLLHIDLVREVPETMKPRRIAIGGGAAEPAMAHADPAEERKAA